ncbi:MAG: rRNA maturation RNase YbeY [Prochlorococcus sp.]|nr:rRNA maturation RNase YbeY [Prochlorococcus sp.]
MSASTERPVDLELDLSFHAASESHWTEPIDSESRHRLTSASAWEQELTTWIQSIRSDLTLTCPPEVRQTQSLSLGLQLTDDANISELNASWRQKPEATDVLSFPALDNNIPMPGSRCVELGDIVVSVTTAQRQAKEHQHSLNRELRWLVSHGLLHLLGWDHPNSSSLDAMLSCQEHLLSNDSKVPSHSDSIATITDDS